MYTLRDSQSGQRGLLRTLRKSDGTGKSREQPLSELRQSHPSYGSRVPELRYGTAAGNCIRCDRSAQIQNRRGLLGIFLGGLGVHNFYLGYIGKAVAQLILTLVGSIFACFLFPLIAVGASSIWGLVEGILILAGSINVDGHNVPLKD